MKRAAGLALAALAAGCVAPVAEPPPAPRPPPPVAREVPPAPAPAPPPRLAVPSNFEFAGELTQGGWIRGRAPALTVLARMGNQAIGVGPDGQFFAAFDRDARSQATLVATTSDGRTIETPLTITPRAWQLERVNTPLRPGGATPEQFARMREGELARIVAARTRETGSEGWRQGMIWPSSGRISGWFGSQRIYRGGEAGAYHSGLDIAGGGGATYVAPADGVVVLAAADELFSLEGHLLIIDHGNGLNSAFLHSSALLVREGDRVRQGQPLGRIGATGRATGPHLHWSLVWRGSRLDPLLFLPPRP